MSAGAIRDLSCCTLRSMSIFGRIIGKPVVSARAVACE
jgi:hypothetical protein